MKRWGWKSEDFRLWLHVRLHLAQNGTDGADGAKSFRQKKNIFLSFFVYLRIIISFHHKKTMVKTKEFSDKQLQ